METNTIELYHQLNRFNLSSEYDFSILHSFIGIVENTVGKSYYENLFCIYDAFFELIQNYPNFKNLRNQNNSYLTSYSDCVQSINDIASNPIYKKSLKSTIESLMDIHYQADLNERVEKIKQDVDAMMDIVLQANEIMRPTESIEPAIAELKSMFNRDIKLIKSSYGKLRVIGELELYSIGCQNQCRTEFYNFINENNLAGQISSDLFDQLWNLLSEESNILINCANLAMSCVIKPILTTDEISDQEIETAQNLFAQYQALANTLIQMKNDNLM